MNNATKFWGAASSCPGSSASTGTLTCDGDGNGLLTPHTATYGNEYFRFWQHMANAGLIEGNYSGVAGGSGAYPEQLPIIGTNVPRGRISSTGYSVFYALAVTADGQLFFKQPSGNIVFFGSLLGNSTAGDAIAPEEAWNIDTKLDDALPASGVVTTPTSSNSNGGTDCATTNVASTAAYDLSKTTKSCSLQFWAFGR